MAVIGVGRFISQRQDYENGVERSYQIEMAARVRIAEGRGGVADRKVVANQTQKRQELQDRISDDTRDTALLVAAGLIAEHLCTIRKDDDDEQPGDPGPGFDAHSH